MISRYSFMLVGLLLKHMHPHHPHPHSRFLDQNFTNTVSDFLYLSHVYLRLWIVIWFAIWRHVTFFVLFFVYFFKLRFYWVYFLLFGLINKMFFKPHLWYSNFKKLKIDMWWIEKIWDCISKNLLYIFISKIIANHE